MWLACVCMVTKGIRAQVTPADNLRLHLLLLPHTHTQRLRHQTSHTSGRGTMASDDVTSVASCLLKSLPSWTQTLLNILFKCDVGPVGLFVQDASPAS